MDYKIIRSRRKTIALTVDENGDVIVRAGLRTSEKFIDSFVHQNAGWIEKQKSRIAQIEAGKIYLSQSETVQMKKDAAKVMTEITNRYAKIMEVKPASIKITSAKTRWGSCSGKNSICYSYRVMVLPQRCREYIAVHELAHIVYKNHSDDFYRLVEKYMPDYKEIVKEINGYHIA
ncbi:MAG: M48 family metallopeptidase [Ruminococcaceae bacterium]|nr:M48 family metallopeptidase [Oscillospiraceae bacterium]